MKTVCADSRPMTKAAKLTHERYEWLYPARGMVALLYLLSAITRPLSGRLLVEHFPLGPTYLNHGYAYYRGYPELITVIDTGQFIFMFLMGFVGYVAFSGRMQKRGASSAWLYAARRVALLFFLQFIGSGVFNMLAGKPINWAEVFYDDILSKLALGAMAAYVTTYFIRNADRRALVAVGVLVVHAFLFASHAVDRYPWSDDMLRRPEFPLGALSLMTVAVVGSACAQWLRMDEIDLRVGFKRRIMPVSVLSLSAAYCLEWLQPSQPHDGTMAVALLSIGLAGLLVAVTYAFGEMRFEVPVLRPLGKNLILVFILGSQLVDRYVRVFPKEFLLSYPYVGMLLVGLLPLAVITLVAVTLEKRNILIRL